MNKKLVGLFTGLVFYGLGASVQAGVIFYNDPVAFAAAAGPLTTIDFEGIVGGSGSSSANSHTFSGVTFAPVGSDASLICGMTSGCAGAPFDSDIYVVNFAVSLDILLPMGTMAAGGFFGDIDGPGFDTIFTVFNQSSALIDTQTEFLNDFGAGLTHDFLGWISNGGDTLSKIHLNNSSNTWIALDNFSVSSSGGTVPEPATLLLMGLGLAGIGFAWKKEKAV